MDRETITRRNLPHWYVPGAMHFVTYRLFGSLPADVIERLHERKQQWLRQARVQRTTLTLRDNRIHAQLFAAFDHSLDNNREVAWLNEPEIAEIVRESLHHHDGDKYHLLSYCIMPNHVHLLIQPRAAAINDGTRQPYGEADDHRSPLAAIMQTLKSFTAHAANKRLRRRGPFWQKESYDHWVRDEAQLEKIVQYICQNPVKAGLANRPEQWKHSSCFERFQYDGDTSGWLGNRSV